MFAQPPPHPTQEIDEAHSNEHDIENKKEKQEEEFQHDDEDDEDEFEDDEEEEEEEEEEEDEEDKDNEDEDKPEDPDDLIITLANSLDYNLIEEHKILDIFSFCITSLLMTYEKLKNIFCLLDHAKTMNEILEFQTMMKQLSEQSVFHFDLCKTIRKKLMKKPNLQSSTENELNDTFKQHKKLMKKVLKMETRCEQKRRWIISLFAMETKNKQNNQLQILPENLKWAGLLIILYLYLIFIFFALFFSLAKKK